MLSSDNLAVLHADTEQDEGLSTRVASALSQVYARFQNAAGEKVSVKPGAAWREALEAASDHGGLQVQRMNELITVPSWEPGMTQVELPHT